MENLMISANAVLPMCLVMALGYGTRRLGWLRREEISTINKIAFRIFLPCLLYYNIYCSDLSGSFDPLLMTYAVGGVLLTFGLALGYALLTEKLPERRGVLIQGMFRSNYVIMGIPVATALLGADQLGTVSILIAVIVPLFNMLAVVVLEVFRGQKPKPLHILGQIAKNPLVIGSVLGILTLVAGIRLPHILEQTIQSVSAIASPLQLFLLGAFFQFSGLRRYARELTAVVAAKLIVFPGLFLGLGALLGFSTTNGEAFGIFAGTAINDTSSVTAAASTWDSLYGLGSQTLDKAVTVKLTRTLAIIPITLVLAFVRTKRAKTDGTKVNFKKIFPMFILYFLLASVITTICVSAGVSASVFTPLKTLSKFLIVMAMCAVGLNTNIVKLVKTGGKPLIMGFCCWVGIAGMSLLMQHVLGIW